ncbi:hypothetical protein ruthe_02356 [Rubellimicrobium thermophilum DSM 16684]|uniref:Uncharacterized protein n=1 Tax=Rubellimicrobium thermophilum DSM 16684 TaxID=1123069 RepID=S9QRZ8_9RHOB|nr:hypothetical protein ruthe_02356 [Rubellimicrobium thermophilum DSM 16684]
METLTAAGPRGPETHPPRKARPLPGSVADGAGFARLLVSPAPRSGAEDEPPPCGPAGGEGRPTAAGENGGGSSQDRAGSAGEPPPPAGSGGEPSPPPGEGPDIAACTDTAAPVAGAAPPFPDALPSHAEWGDLSDGEGADAPPDPAAERAAMPHPGRRSAGRPQGMSVASPVPSALPGAGLAGDDGPEPALRESALPLADGPAHTGPSGPGSAACGDRDAAPLTDAAGPSRPAAAGQAARGAGLPVLLSRSQPGQAGQDSAGSSRPGGIPALSPADCPPGIATAAGSFPPCGMAPVTDPRPTGPALRQPVGVPAPPPRCGAHGPPHRPRIRCRSCPAGDSEDGSG